jgi:hypothetical protein
MLSHVVHGFQCVAAMLSFLCPGDLEEPASELSPAIAVRVYNLAEAPLSVLASAEAEAGKILQQAGIDITWFPCGRSGETIKDQGVCSEPAVPAKPVVRILSRCRPEPGVTGETVGFAIPSASIANISFDRVAELMPYVAASRGHVLGLVVAHEIGHLLLQTEGHWPVGIMHFPWSLRELGLANANLLVFTVTQAHAMRKRTLSSIWQPTVMDPSALTDRLSVPRLGAQPPDTVLKIEVHVYNYSAVSSEKLVRAEQEAARIFERIGVATTWLDCPLTSQEAARNRACALPDAPTRLTLRLLSNPMANSLGVSGDVFGSALLPDTEGFGVMANVYADRTREHADHREFEVILGRVIAHELGHLLLGKNAHSAAGIMHARWRDQDLRLFRQAAMLFLPGEAKRIRAQVLARMGGTAR